MNFSEGIQHFYYFNESNEEVVVFGPRKLECNNKIFFLQVSLVICSKSDFGRMSNLLVVSEILTFLFYKYIQNP